MGGGLRFVAAALFLLPASAVGAEPSCPGFSPELPTVRLAGVDAAGDPVLADGRSLRLVGIAPRQDGPEARRFAASLSAWNGRDLKLVTLPGADRWGRLPARLFAAGGGEGGPAEDIAASLLRAGAAAFLPEPGQDGCSAELRAAVAKGASAVAADGAAALVDGHDLAALRAHAGQIILLEGRIASVGERSRYTYLNFSRRRGEAASVMLPRQLWRELKDGGWTVAALGGKRLRARGILSGRDGLLLEVRSRFALELVD